MATLLRDIAAALEAWAPPGAAQSYDNVGLQVGDPAREVRRALVALDATPGVVDEALAWNAELILTHHPLLFRPLKRLAPGEGAAGLAFRLAERGIALYSAHTNLDAAADGVSFTLGRQLGLVGLTFLEPLADSLNKLVTFVPAAHADRVREALGRAGAGRIGAYTNCAFASPGTGYFTPGANASPFIGTPGGPAEAVDELRLEVEVDRWALGRVLEALREAHPYEEVAYDVYPVHQPATRFGMGALGDLEAPEALGDFLQRTAERLNAPALRYTGDLRQPVRRVAVCGGSGSSLLPHALRRGADAFVTADVTYHRYFDVLAADGTPRLALIDPGHYETERMTEALLARRLAERFPDVAWRETSVRTSPVSTFIRA